MITTSCAVPVRAPEVGLEPVHSTMATTRGYDFEPGHQLNSSPSRLLDLKRPKDPQGHVTPVFLAWAIKPSRAQSLKTTESAGRPKLNQKFQSSNSIPAQKLMSSHAANLPR